MPKKTYSTEDKLNALRLCDEIGVLKTSEKTGITVNSLYAWRRRKEEIVGVTLDIGEAPAVSAPAIIMKRAGAGHKKASIAVPVHDELTRLRIEIDALKAQNRMLKDALRVFTV